MISIQGSGRHFEVVTETIWRDAKMLVVVTLL